MNNEINDELKTMVEGIKKGIEEAFISGDISYFEDVLDIEYFVGGDGNLRGVKIAVTLGGPNIFVNTKTKEINGYWGYSEYTEYITADICNFIDSIFEEYLTAVI